MVGCGSATQASNESTHTDTSTKKYLTVKSLPNVSYYQYEQINLKGLEVVGATERSGDPSNIEIEEITDYKLTFKDTGEEFKDDDFLMDVGDFEIIVSKDGYQNTSFTISVNQARTLVQSISITSAATKSSYFIGDSLSLDGLQITLKTKTNGKITRNYTTIVDDYKIDVNGVEGKDYKFTSTGVFKITITVDGWDRKELTTYYTVSCIPEDTLSTPKEYNDKTISWETDTTNMTVSIKNEAQEETTGKGYYSPDEVINEYNIVDYSEKNAASFKYTPSTGKVPLLVIPIITPGDESKANEDNWNMINKAFFGDSTDLNFESVHSYYYKSSYGQLDFTGGTTGYFDPKTVDSKYKSISGYTEDNIFELPQLALDWAEEEYNLDLTKYDSNNDGYVDGIWFVYLHNSSSSGSNFWAFTSSTNSINTDSEKPIANCFGWASIDFINDQFSSNYSYSSFENANCDAHVLIHETGHMLGLKDYYSYYSSYTGYSPLGQADMMDHNVGDQNPYSKLLLNWVTPYVVYGDCTITIPSSQSKNALIIIPEDNKQFKFNSDGKLLFNTMDEYLVLDYYTVKNMNRYDYDCYSVNHIDGDGARLYHVDNRVCKVTREDDGNHFALYDDPITPFEDDNTDEIYRVISNSEAGSKAESHYGLDTSCNAYDEIRMISRNKAILSTTNPATKSALFRQGDTFSLTDYKSQFNGTTFNNKNSCSYTLSITSIA